MNGICLVGIARYRGYDDKYRGYEASYEGHDAHIGRMLQVCAFLEQIGL